MKGSFWTAESDTTLRAMHAGGHRFKDIGERLGVTKNAIAGRAERLGLEQRRRSVLTDEQRAVAKSEKQGKQNERRRKARRVKSAKPANPGECRAPRVTTFRTALVEPLHVTLYDIERFQCRWAYGESLSYTFCGHPQQADSSYCPAHHALSVDKVRTAQRPPLGIMKRAA